MTAFSIRPAEIDDAAAPRDVLRRSIAERAGAVVGVGGMAAAGEMTLNFVPPAARLEGVGTALPAAIGDRLRGQGVARSRLSSTATAPGFQGNRGYLEVGRSLAFGSMTDYHMAKQLRGRP